MKCSKCINRKKDGHEEPCLHCIECGVPYVEGTKEKLKDMFKLESGVIVGRHIEGITLNSLEYLLDEDGEPIVFENEEKAKEFLQDKGFMDEDMYWMVFEEAEHSET